MTTTTGSLEVANSFELKGHGVEVRYSATSIAGVPLLAYREGGADRSFRGDEIRVEETSLGALVTVTLAVIPDLKVDTFSLVLPRVHVEGIGGEAKLDAPAIWTTHHTSIAGPSLVRGPLATYRTATLSGVARALVF